MKPKVLILMLLMAGSSIVMKAQNGEVWLGLRAGHNATSSGFAAVSLEVDYSLERHFSIDGGIQYSTIGKSAMQVRPSYFYDMSWGKLSAEILLHYTNSFSINNFCTGAGISLSTKWANGTIGYYYRTYAGRTSRINEPFNIYYSFAINCLPKIRHWDLQLIMTNCETFELDRHYQPSFIAQGWYYPRDFMGITLGIGYKPAGMFHLSADYYQSFAKAGICYRW